MLAVECYRGRFKERPLISLRVCWAKQMHPHNGALTSSSIHASAGGRE